MEAQKKSLTDVIAASKRKRGLLRFRHAAHSVKSTAEETYVQRWVARSGLVIRSKQHFCCIFFPSCCTPPQLLISCRRRRRSWMRPMLLLFEETAGSGKVHACMPAMPACSHAFLPFAHLYGVFCLLPRQELQCSGASAPRTLCLRSRARIPSFLRSCCPSRFL